MKFPLDRIDQTLLICLSTAKLQKAVFRVSDKEFWFGHQNMMKICMTGYEKKSTLVVRGRRICVNLTRRTVRPIILRDNS